MTRDDLTLIADRSRARALRAAAERITRTTVHPLEAVAFLESEGFADRDARRLGKPNLFVLAGGLRDAEASAGEVRAAGQISTVGGVGVNQAPDLQSLEIPIVTTPEGMAPIRAERAPYRLLVRGIVYFLPALALAALLPPVLTRTELIALPVALALSWAGAQAIAYVAYQQTGFGPGSEAQFLRRALTVGAGLASAVGLSLFLIGIVSSGSAVAVTAQACLMISTAALVINGRELYLTVLLLPGAIAGALRLVSGERSQVGVIVAAACLLLATVAAWVVTSRSRPADRPDGVILPSLRRTAPHALSGGLLAVLALWIPTTAGFDPTVALAAAALVLVSGGAEYLLVALRHEGRADLTRHADLQAFQRAVGGRLARAIVIYAAVVASGQALTWVLFPPSGGAEVRHAVLISAAMVVLGVIFFIQGVAVSLYGVTRVLPLSLAAALVLAATAGLHGSAGAGTFLLVALPLLVGSTLVAYFQSYIPSNHR